MGMIIVAHLMAHERYQEIHEKLFVSHAFFLVVLVDLKICRLCYGTGYKPQIIRHNGI